MDVLFLKLDNESIINIHNIASIQTGSNRVVLSSTDNKAYQLYSGSNAELYTNKLISYINEKCRAGDLIIDISHFNNLV